MLVEGGVPGANLRRAAAMIQQAADAGCELVVLPECLDLGWTWPEARNLARPIPGECSHQLAAAAKKHGIWVVAGLTERDADQVFNCAVLISSAGDVIAKHRKINELAIAHDLYDVGDRIAAVSSPFGLVGVTICADNFPDSLVFGHALARMGVRTLLSPCAWAVDADHDNTKEPYGDLWLTAYRRLASLYDMNVVGVSCVGWLAGGPWKGRKCIGNSMAVGPGGRILAVAPYGVDAECLVTVELAFAAPIARGADFAHALKERGYWPGSEVEFGEG
jgi:predicted amidohydrolase